MVRGQPELTSVDQRLTALADAREAQRLKLAFLGAREAAFDWTLDDDRVDWLIEPQFTQGAFDPSELCTGEAVRTWLSVAARAELATYLSQRVPDDPTFCIEFESYATRPTEWYELRAVRSPGQNGRAERVTGVVKLITPQKKMLKRLTYLACFDELTGHLNRTRLRERLTSVIGRAVAENRSCAYVVASIDSLAVINETYGFDVADEVIVAVGQRLAQTLRGSDVIGRTAGNKFGVILGDCGEHEMSLVAERLRSAVRSEVIETRAGAVSATVSIGAVWLPASASTSQEAMLRAEEAIEQARAMGRNGFAVYAKSEQKESARRRLMTIADELVAALNEHRLVFAYQPIVSAKTRLPERYECLVRLRRPDGTIANAGEFVPAAETLGLVRLVDRRALEMAVAQLYAHPEVKLSINVSGTTAGDPSWLQSFINYVRENREVAERMTVELTETAALHAFEENARFVSRLRDMGCRVAIDDFGAGYTSFRNLHNLRVDTVKIDGSYVKNLSRSPDNQLFVRTLNELAKNFQLETVAEWVSCEEDAQLLESYGVDHFQGYYVGEPVLEPDWLKR
jgi:diguanylate cyclase (GGDEF)-like protein